MTELLLRRLDIGSNIHVIAGEGDDANELRFRVLGIKEGFPVCDFRQRPAGDDAILGPARVLLEGCTGGILIGKDEDGSGYDYKDDDPDVEPGNGLLQIGGFIAIVDLRGTSPLPNMRRRIVPAICGIALQRS